MGQLAALAIATPTHGNDFDLARRAKRLLYEMDNAGYCGNVVERSRFKGGLCLAHDTVAYRAYLSLDGA